MHFKVWMGIRGLSQKDVADQLGLSPSYLSEILNGKKKPPLDVARRIEEYTGGEVRRLEILYPDEAGDSMPDDEIILLAPRGTPLTTELRKRILAAAARGAKHAV